MGFSKMIRVAELVGAVKAVKSKADDVVKKTAQSKDVAKTGLGKKINEKVNDVAEKVAKKSEEAIKKSDDIKKVDMKVTKTMKNQDKNQLERRWYQ